jgi:hypothetical protein
MGPKAKWDPRLNGNNIEARQAGISPCSLLQSWALFLLLRMRPYEKRKVDKNAIFAHYGQNYGC